ncbi:DNA repair protein RecO [Spiroplasma turonicum]|uniref:DNA repair protein RecO n=1 Tax=Spiroplasma turonicum TaxID=216946 RepID=A0A0K1P5T0_9MOLU|nr:DNA repair protein RecO [Spiroplasma turonicum]AKU79524.1 DNA repair protein recO [Spiroplasma turonicum]ALX70547.1 DNA repair protein recO [Spiroplasma turonicum]
MKSTKGIVIDLVDFEDYAKVVTIFSEEFGKLAFYAPGVNKSNSKNKYSVQLFNISEFEIFKSRTIDKLSKLKTGILIHDLLNIATSYTTYIFATIIIKVLSQINEISNKNKDIYNIAENILLNMKNSNNVFLNYIIFLFKVLKLTPYKFNLKHCERCGNSDKIVRFDYVKNTIICKRCITRNETIQPYSFLETLRIINEFKLEEILKHRFNNNDLLITHSILIEFYENILGFNLGPIYLLKNFAPLTYTKEVADLYK